jgi:hypothetical protein
VGNPKNTIELNGQLYDAATGARIASTTAVKTAASTPVQHVDGFTRPKLAKKPVVHVAAPAKKRTGAPKQVKPAVKSVQRSGTLMRSVVKKPQTTTAAHHVPKPAAIHKTQSQPAARQARADQVNQSTLISKFGRSSRPSLSTQVTALPVKAPPRAEPPVMDLRAQIAAVTASPKTFSNQFERALHQADSHKQPKLKKQKLVHKAARKAHITPKVAQIGSALAAAFIIGGFFFYQNIPNLSMRVAATRAGVSAALPSYHPAGFSMSRQIQYSPGQIKVSYHSNSDQRAFDVIQKKSDWSKQDLVNNFVAANNRTYQTYQDNDRTIYIYDGSNAAWVDRGVLYQIEGSSSLNSDQLLRLAASI